MQVLYATDGSERSLAGAHLLATLPLGADCRITVLTVVPPNDPADGEEALAAARAALGGRAAQVETQVRRGNPAEEILRAADELPAELLVVGWSGHAAVARFFLGSVAERVARHAACSVLIARPLRRELRELMVGVDGSPGAALALRRLERLALPTDSEVRLVTVLPRMEDLTRTSPWLPLPLMASKDAHDFLERLRQEAQARLSEGAEALAAAGQRAVTEIRRGDAAMALIEAAEDEAVDLIVVGAQGHGRVHRFLLGAVPEKLLRHAPCSLLLVRSRE
jgi:nucleotide-binding universal stress UspA family protein